MSKYTKVIPEKHGRVGLVRLNRPQALNALDTTLLSELMDDPDVFVHNLESIPIIHKLFPEEEQLVKTIEDVVKSMGNFIIDGLSDFSAGTANFIFLLFIFLFRGRLM